MDLSTMSSRTPSTSSSSPRPMKKENEEEIKEFAETAMNELLGWYGYERLELRRWAAARKDASPDAEHKDKEDCAWCSKPAATQLQHAGAAFCSEQCFSQSRRANFKRAKTCDWCRHVRHTVAYVDFQDGATQLQFCSDKCLNQYKMHIFCRETQAHLDLHPHLAAAASTSSLITPELWLKNCRSRSGSPNSEKSSPEIGSKERDASKSPLPLITVAPAAKLMKRDDKRTERKDARKMSLRKRKCPATVTSQSRKFQKLPEKSPASSPVSAAVHSPPHPAFPFPSPFVDTPEPRLPMFHPRPSFVRPPPPMPERPRLPYLQHTLGQVPPVTIMVPYPVVIPLPIPIPIPLPMSAFIQAQLSRVKTEAKSDENEGPLDFTMNGDKKKDERADEKEMEEKVEEGSPEQTLPKFKITRVGKVPKLVARPRDQSESSRPLRKRRRLVEVASEEDSMKTRKIVQV